MADPVRIWAGQKLSGLLQMPAEDCEAIVENILMYDDPEELRSFLSAFTEDNGEFKVAAFVSELFQFRGGAAKPPPPPARPAGQAAGGRGLGTGPDAVTVPSSGRGGRGGQEGRGGGRGGRGTGRGESAAKRKEDDEADFPRLLMPMKPRDKADKRLMIIDAASGRHKVLTNCLNCGKVIVEEEGWGPCLFCGNPLEKGDHCGVKHGDDRGYRETTDASELVADKFNESFEKAKNLKDRLLSYDRDAKRRTKVVDDATDWYSESVNPWLNEKQREDALKMAADEERRQKEEKRRVHATIDIFGRTVIDCSAEVAAERKAKDRSKFEDWAENANDSKKVLSMYAETQRLGGAAQLSSDSRQLYDRLRASLHAAGKNLDKANSSQDKSLWGTDQDGPSGGGAPRRDRPRWDASIDKEGRIEDEFSHVSLEDFSRGSAAVASNSLVPYQESPYPDDEDQGVCLSMHQPWASLLVHGFKRAEGRSWSTQHRGRLWIHAGGKPPDAAEIKRLEAEYQQLYEARGVPVPPMPSKGAGYPTSALLGCVDLEQCWSNQEYMKVLDDNPSMPREENDNDFVFWCMRPRRLIVPVKMGGDHKLWRLQQSSQSSLAAAQRGLQPVRWPAPRDGETALTSPPLPERAVGAAPSGHGGGGASKGSTAALSKEPLLDLWPTEKPLERLHVLEKESADRDVVILQNGFVNLPSFVPQDLQQRLIDLLREVGTSPQGFFREQSDGNKLSSEVSRMNMGLHWNVAAQKWEPTRGDIDRGPVAELPKMLVDLYGEAVKRANRELRAPQHKKRKMVPFVESSQPSIGVVNFYAPGASMQLHQDKTESPSSIAAGLPVVCICLGDSCDFVYGDGKATKTMRLESGDVYLFGGDSRLMWHGVAKVLPQTAPPSLRLRPGRLSVTLRAA